MKEENNVFGQFGARNSKFDELLKKYQTIDEDGTVQSEELDEPDEQPETPAAQMPEPALQPDDDDDEDDDFYDLDDDEDDDDDDDEDEDEDAPSEAAEDMTERQSVTPQTHGEQDSFSFDEVYGEPERTQPEPDFSYDLDMFGTSSTKGAVNIDDFDDSWLDSALDDSLFYNAAASLPAEPEAAQPNPESEVQPEPEKPTVIQTDGFAESSVHGADVSTAAGGYIAPSDFSDFAFDPDSGMDFGSEEDGAASAEQAVEQPEKKPSRPKKKAAKEKKDSGKNEMSSVTDFSKNYKASEGKGSKKDGFFVRNFVPKKSDSVAEKVRKIIMIICVLAFLGSAGYLFNDYVIAPIKNSSQMNELEGLIGESNEVVDTATLAEKYPGITFPEGMLEKYADLYARNQDFVGWITIDGLDISLPVVRGENNEKYLKTDFDGKSSKYGSIFMNCTNRVDRLNYNTSLFGHYMYDSKMFGNLIQYKSASGYKKAPIIEFNTIYGDYKWKIFAVFITNGTKDGDNGYLFNYMFTDLSTQDAVEDFMGEIKQRSLYYPKVDIAVSDKILTLSTCTYEFDEARLVVMARMVRPGESDTVDTSVLYNPNPRYPAAYYKENSLSNPYDSAYRWYPS